LAGKGKHNARLGRALCLPFPAKEIRLFELSEKEIFYNYDETKSKEEKNKKN